MKFRAMRARARDQNIRRRYQWRETRHCYWCGIEVSYSPTARNRPYQATREHLIPRSHGGPGGRVNIVVACRRCNTTRGNATNWIPWHEQDPGTRRVGVPAIREEEE